MLGVNLALHEVHLTQVKLLLNRNGTPAPPVGMYKECQHYVAEWVGDGESIPAECIHPLTGLLVISDDDFCSYFEPKESEGND